MYRIRVINKDKTLGGFLYKDGTTDDPSLAETYSSDLDLKEPIKRAYNISGAMYQPVVNYNISTIELANSEKQSYDASIVKQNSLVGKQITEKVGVRQPKLPPFEDKPTRTDGGITATTRPPSDIDGGYLSQEQEIDLNGGSA